MSSERPGESRITAPRPRSIRRYENRKLYDAEAGRYVTLDEVGRLVAGGGEVEVVDQKTGEDLTSFTLAQVLLERVRTGAGRIPRQVLAGLIRIAAGRPSPRGRWPEPQDLAGRARQETERIVARVLGRGGLSLDEAVALRQDVAQVVHRLVAEAHAGIESRLKGLLERSEGVAGRSLDALRGGLEAFEAYLEGPPATPRRAATAPATARRAAGGAPSAPRRRRARRRGPETPKRSGPKRKGNQPERRTGTGAKEKARQT